MNVRSVLLPELMGDSPRLVNFFFFFLTGRERQERRVATQTSDEKLPHLPRFGIHGLMGKNELREERPPERPHEALLPCPHVNKHSTFTRRDEKKNGWSRFTSCLIS